MPVDQMYALHWPPTIRRIKEAAVPPAGGLTHGSNGGGIHVLPRHALSSPSGGTSLNHNAFVVGLKTGITF